MVMLNYCFSREGKSISRKYIYCSENKFVPHPCWMESNAINLPPGGDLYSQEMAPYLGISAGLNH